MEFFLNEVLFGLCVIKESDPNFEYSNSGVTIDHICKVMKVDKSYSKWIEAKLLVDGFVEFINKDYGMLVRITPKGYLFRTEGGYSQPGKKKPTKKPPTFEELFVDKEYIELFLNAMPEDVITPAGTFIGINDRPTEILALIEALKIKGYLKKHGQTLTATIFCKRFKVIIGDRTKRSKSRIVMDCIQDYVDLLPSITK